MDVMIKVVKSTYGAYFTILSAKENCPEWDYNVVGTGRSKPTQGPAIEEGRLVARRLGHEVVKVVRWRGPNKRNRVPGMLKNEKDLWIKATRLRNQTDLPSREFTRVIACDGSVLLVLKEHTSLAKGAKIRRS